MKVISSLLIGLSLVGCGLTKKFDDTLAVTNQLNTQTTEMNETTKKMAELTAQMGDNVQKTTETSTEMNAKMDVSNKTSGGMSAKMDTSLAKLDQSNATSTQLLAEVSSTAVATKVLAGGMGAMAGDVAQTVAISASMEKKLDEQMALTKTLLKGATLDAMVKTQGPAWNQIFDPASSIHQRGEGAATYYSVFTFQSLVPAPGSGGSLAIGGFAVTDMKKFLNDVEKIIDQDSELGVENPIDSAMYCNPAVPGENGAPRSKALGLCVLAALADTVSEVQMQNAATFNFKPVSMVDILQAGLSDDANLSQSNPDLVQVIKNQYRTAVRFLQWRAQILPAFAVFDYAREIESEQGRGPFSRSGILDSKMTPGLKTAYVEFDFLIRILGEGTLKSSSPLAVGPLTTAALLGEFEDEIPDASPETQASIANYLKWRDLLVRNYGTTSAP